MRQEVTKLVDEACKIAELCWQRISDNNSDAAIGNEYLEKQSNVWLNLTKCLKENKEIQDIYAGSAGSIVIDWDDKPNKHNIVIEISLYAPLTAVYKYGPVPNALLAYVYRCIEDCGLVVLTDEEVAVLEQEKKYHFIF